MIASAPRALLARVKPHRRRILMALAALIVAYLLYAGVQTYRHAASLRAHAVILKEQALTNPTIVGAALHAVQRDVTALQRDLAPLLLAARGLGWLPWIGPTLRAGPVLLSAGALYLDAGVVAWDVAGVPAAEALTEDASVPELISAVVSSVSAERADLAWAAAEARRASDAIAAIEADRLLPPLRAPMVRAQAVLPLAAAAFEGLPLLPELAPLDDTRTYLLLAQNNDELRATGGFISSIGTVTFDHGVPSLGAMSDSYSVEDWTVAHPDPPEELRTYMGIDLWTTRDANWSPDFPTSARAVADLYELNRDTPVDGVIAVDMAAAARLLDTLAPLTLPDGTVVVPGGVMDALRRGWSLPNDALVTPGVTVTASHAYEALEVELVYSRQTGRAWFDAVEVIDPSRPGENLVENASFEEGGEGSAPPGWEGLGLTTGDGLVANEAYEGERAFFIAGDVAVDKALRQRIVHAGEAGATLNVRVMSRTENTDWRAGPYAVVVRFIGADGVTAEQRLRVPDLAYHWATAGSTDILAEWLANRKGITQELTMAGVGRLAGGADARTALGALEELAQLLRERHIQCYVADPAVQGLLARSGWDGAVAQEAGDYLLVIDSNTGYNKVTASLEQSLRYAVEIDADGTGHAELMLHYRNASTRATGVCDKFRGYVPVYELLTEGCYWGHVRVYVPAGAVLEEAIGSDDGAAVARDAGRTVFSGSLFLEPGQEREMLWRYTLPASVVGRGDYALMVQKQAGTDALPLEVTVNAPGRISAFAPAEAAAVAVADDDRVTLRTDLRYDRHLNVRWRERARPR